LQDKHISVLRARQGLWSSAYQRARGRVNPIRPEGKEGSGLSHAPPWGEA